MSLANVKKNKHVPISELKKFFYVKGSTLYWKKDLGKAKKDQIAGYPNKDGYFDVSFNKRRYYAHRISFAISYGKWPEGVIDHIDGNKANNSPENLRDVTDSVNNFNAKIRIDNTTGIKGVSKHSGGFSAELTAFKKRYRKWFKNIKDAENWIKETRLKIHGEYANNGEVK